MGSETGERQVVNMRTVNSKEEAVGVESELIHKETAEI